MHKLRLSFFLLFVFVSLALVIFPEYDIKFSGFFYETNRGFVHNNNQLVSFIFKSIPFITKFLALDFVLVLLYKIKSPIKMLKPPTFFLFLALAIGPGLIVNYGFKENFGRARPREIVEFGGNKEFSRAAIITDQCKTNCSFSSGHAAMGYYFTAFTWVAPLNIQNIVFFMTFLFGTSVGLGRILQGGHFLSDITFSFVIVILVNEICYRFWLFLRKKYTEKKCCQKVI